MVTAPDTFVGGYDKRDDLLWYRRNPAYTAVDASMKQQLLNVTEEQGLRDVLKNNTFGALVSGTQTSPASYEFAVVVHVRQTASAGDWLRQLKAKAAEAARTPFDAAKAAHTATWAKTWQRSWMRTSAAARSELWNHTFAAAVGRYVNLIQQRGDTPSHFTGGIFTFDADDAANPGKSYDYRAWGGAYWWQNTRFAYAPMLQVRTNHIY